MRHGIEFVAPRTGNVNTGHVWAEREPNYEKYFAMKAIKNFHLENVKSDLRRNLTQVNPLGCLTALFWAYNSVGTSRVLTSSLGFCFVFRNLVSADMKHLSHSVAEGNNTLFHRKLPVVD